MKTHRIPYIFLLFIACLATARTAAQSSHRIAGKSIVALRQEEVAVPMQHRLLQQSFMPLYYPLFRFRGQAPGASAAERSPALLRAFSPSDLAFFCRLEFKLEKTVRFPVKIRLGEVQYVDQLEGK
jgi:hypothetical protein